MAKIENGQVFQLINAKLARAADPDFGPLMEQWEALIVEGNRRGVLSGRDGNDQPMPPLKYRGGRGKRTFARKGGVHGTTLFLPGEGGGSSSAYRNATGPRLAPFGERSRSIANLVTGHGREGKNVWYAVGGWLDVVSRKGVPFLPFHFRGGPHLPRYDLRPVSQQERTKARTMMLAYVRSLIKWGRGT